MSMPRDDAKAESQQPGFGRKQKEGATSGYLGFDSSPVFLCLMDDTSGTLCMPAIKEAPCFCEFYGWLLCGLAISPPMLSMPCDHTGDVVRGKQDKVQLMLSLLQAKKPP